MDAGQIVRALLFVGLGILGGCTRPAITSLGNGVSVPTKAVEEYATSHGITRAEARSQMRADVEAERVRAYAKGNGLTLEEAQRQLARDKLPSPSK